MLTLFAVRLKIYNNFGGEFQHNLLLSTLNHCEKTKIFFALEIVHTEIGIVTKFGDVWRLYNDTRVKEFIFKQILTLKYHR